MNKENIIMLESEYMILNRNINTQIDLLITETARDFDRKAEKYISYDFKKSLWVCKYYKYMDILQNWCNGEFRIAGSMFSNSDFILNSFHRVFLASWFHKIVGDLQKLLELEGRSTNINEKEYIYRLAQNIVHRLESNKLHRFTGDNDEK